MVQSKKINMSTFAGILEKVNSQGELIRSKQDQKQAVIDQFEREKQRYRKGKISQAALASSVRITNNQLIRLDKNIRETIAKHNRLSESSRKMVSNQSPKVFRAHLFGIRGNKKSSSKKKRGKRTSRSKKAPRRKRTPNPGITRILSEERRLDRKYQR